MTSFEDAGKAYYEDFCLSSSGCYTLTFSDTYGDGFIDGSFQVTVDNNVILTKGEMESFTTLEVDFGQCNTPPVTSPTDPPVTSPPVNFPTDPPVTDPPVTSPTSPPIVITSCEADELEVAISVTTDTFPEELSWSMENYEMPGDLILQQYTTYEKTLCLDANSCHTFNIQDTFGDGIIVEEGDFSVKVNNNVKLSLGNGFTTDKSVAVGNCVENNKCPKQWQAKLTVELTTDAFPDDNYLVVKRRKNNKFRKTVYYEDNFAVSATNVYSVCLRKNKCYRVTVGDIFGDGICCAFGDGDVKSYWKGELVENQNDGFTDGEYALSKPFGNC